MNDIERAKQLGKLQGHTLSIQVWLHMLMRDEGLPEHVRKEATHFDNEIVKMREQDQW